MSRTQYLEGLTLLALVLGAAGAVATLVVRAFLGHLDRLERGLAGGLVGLVALVGIHLVPLVLGVLSQATVLASSAIAVAGAWAIVHARAARPSPVAQPAPRPRSVGSGRASLAVAAGAALLVVGAVASEVRRTFGQPIGCVDSLSFHLPNVARWMESGSLWQYDQFIPLQAQGAYPNTGDVVLLSVLLPFGDDALARWPMLALFAVLAVAIVAVARELGAPRATGVSVAAAVCAIPILARATVDCAMPDVLLLCGFTTGGLFLLRHARTGLPSDLVLAGLGLGLALGTKWYGVPVAVLAWLVAMGARAVVGAGTARVAREAGGVAGIVAVVGGIWFVRNAVEVGNPVFPVDLPLLDTPRDVVREQVGFNILHYVGDWDVLFGDLPREIEQGLGLIPVVLLAAVVAAVAVLLRGQRDRRLLALVVLSVVLFVAYTSTPYTALGLEGDPAEARFNTRYAIPAVLAGMGVLLLLARRARWLALTAELALGGVVLWALPDAYAPWGASAVATSALLGAALGVVVLAGRTRPALAAQALRPVPVAAAVVLVLVGAAAYGWRTERSQERQRYAANDPVLAILDTADRLPGSLDVAIGGDWNAQGISPVWPAFGRRITNRVEVLGFDNDGFLTNHRSRRAFLADLSGVEPDLLVVGRGLRPRPGVDPPEQGWAASAGWRTRAASDRLVLMTPPGR